MDGVVADDLSEETREKKCAKTRLSASEPAIHKIVHNCNLTSFS